MPLGAFQGAAARHSWISRFVLTHQAGYFDQFSQFALRRAARTSHFACRRISAISFTAGPIDGIRPGAARLWVDEVYGQAEPGGCWKRRDGIRQPPRCDPLGHHCVRYDRVFAPRDQIRLDNVWCMERAVSNRSTKTNT